MAHYFVGDIQGCFSELTLLLNRVGFTPSKDELWCVGDLVARGPESLETLCFLESLGDAAKVVLGNHDLHLLATHAGLKRVKFKDKVDPLLNSPDIDKLITWLRQQPLMRELPEHKLIMTHAGVPPQWDIDTLRIESAAVSTALTQDNYVTDLIEGMYTETPEDWSPELRGIARHRYCINALTRMRYLYNDGKLDFAIKVPPAENTHTELTPWYDLPSKTSDFTRVFGHWAALMGEVPHDNLQALDTGCCWGEYMTLWHLETNEKIIQPSLYTQGN